MTSKKSLLPGKNQTRRGLRVAAIGVVAAAVAALAWPPPSGEVADAPKGGKQFIWGRDSLWRALEATFAARRADGCAGAGSAKTALNSLDRRLMRLRGDRVPATDASLDSLESDFFRLAPKAAACWTIADEYVALQGHFREAIKWQSTAWDVSARDVRDRLYRSLYGSRAAVEEVILQQRDSIPSLLIGSAVPSATPSARSNGVVLHSGDILVSRGGYPTSALIARGNDYPGNFSHIAFVYVDSATRQISVIEAHIESGVMISSADQYLADKKLRVMLLRLRPDLPALQRDPMLPHRAAASMLRRARTEHVPYDFTMDYADASRLFCSEVASAAYREFGVTLWSGISTITASGLRRWLSSFGVRQFETQEPSDLEYDPQVAVVAEWRNTASLFDDHLDNAVTDVMLEGAERGDALEFDWYALPVARLLKGYSWLVARLGDVGTIPEGMSPSAALRNRAYGARHAAIKAALQVEVDRATTQMGYRPPYWSLVALARHAASSR